jgi:hypothetical protein
MGSRHRADRSPLEQGTNRNEQQPGPEPGATDHRLRGLDESLLRAPLGDLGGGTRFVLTSGSYGEGKKDGSRDHEKDAELS